ncbi:MAG: transglutaminase domain-containing protein [Anaerolineae bacterium]|jgi:transglutaminase-like putative cysteine protease|nr:transglutaminase domain-containing protein [Anaerolineae bacterium]MBT7074961.1 transglutaminase domain-containing protein [Anaerolineae bacterium]MBT7783481.1 transglutaminase domain-containing protein [Anaerolineae bacterium]
MNKYKFLLITFLIILTACVPEPKTQERNPLTREYHVFQEIALFNSGSESPDQQNLWVALIRDFAPYQEVHSRKISPSNHILLTDEYGNEYAEFDFSIHPPGKTLRVEITYEITVNEIFYDLSHCEGELIDEYTQPELHIEAANPQILEISKRLAQKESNVCEKARAFYDYAGDNLIYRFNQKSWGAQTTMGLMGSDCTEYSSLVIALSRAEKIPARYYEGLLYLDNKTENLADAQHAWMDIYFPSVGWVAMDPTLGRMENARDNYFAHYTPDHIIVTTGRNPSVLRGSSYMTHLYWPGNSTKIKLEKLDWKIELIE